MSWFDRLARRVARAMGHPLAFLLALAVILLWAALGPLTGYSESWQLVVNTGTTISTFLAVFVLQNSQNRDGDAMQKKLDELIRSIERADDRFAGIEER